ncbi:MAG: VOC family protein [Micrococcales bacterium]|nr:VOC family protein [Micrococcales bacterium]
MTSRVAHTSVDCRNAYDLSEWWKAVLDYTDLPDDPNLPGHEECMIVSRDGTHRILFIEVPEGKSVKNRLHFDLEPVEGTRDDELARLLDLGAVEFADHRGQYGPGTGWVTLLDPEGNELCILRNEAERTAASAGPPIDAPAE